MELKRIVIVGVSCSGKTTYGRNLSKILGHRFVDLDDINWSPGWVSTPREELLPKVKEALGGERWIISGNYSAVQDFIFNEVDTIVWLDYSRFVVAKRAISRTFRRVFLKEACCNGNYETIRQTFFSKDSILLWVYKTYSKRKNRYTALKKDERYRRKNFLHFKNPLEAQNYLDKLQ